MICCPVINQCYLPDPFHLFNLHDKDNQQFHFYLQFGTGHATSNPETFGRRVGTDCGLSARYPLFKEYIPILSCKRDVTVHLKRLNVSSSSVSSESELILLRSGHFNKARRRYDCMPKAPGRSWAILAYFSFLYTSITWVQKRKMRKGCIEENVSRNNDEVEQVGSSWIRWSIVCLLSYLQSC